MSFTNIFITFHEQIPSLFPKPISPFEQRERGREKNLMHIKLELMNTKTYDS